MGSNEMIGHDPLAWIKEDSAEDEAPAVEFAPAQPVETALEERETEAVAAVVAPAEPEAVPPPVVEQRVVEAPAPAAPPRPVVNVEIPAPAPAVTEMQPPAAVADLGGFDLGEQLVISNVGKTRAEWMDRINAGVESPVTIEGGGIQSIDTAGLQLVIALIRELNEDGVSWQWGGRSDFLQSSASQLGLSQALSL
jgi:hypothetical protein